MSFIGAAIRRERLAAGLSPVQCAAQIRFGPGPRGGHRYIATGYLQDVEAGRTLPGPEFVLATANVFPDVDSAEWLWLLLLDMWGSRVTCVMRRQAAQQWSRGEGVAVLPCDPPCTCVETDRGTDRCPEHGG